MATINTEPFYLNTLVNIAFNFIDIWLELENSYLSLDSSSYENFGISVGKIISNVFIKNPMDISWTKQNSDIIMSALTA
jgi:hypothetical protein